jgi:hypothetical protein
MPLGQVGGLGRVRSRPARQVQVDLPLEGGQVPLLQCRGNGPLQPVRPDPVERGTTPQRQGGGDPGPFGRRVGRRGGLVEQAAEPQRVHPVRFHGQHIAARTGRDQLLTRGADGPAQPLDVRADVGPVVTTGIRTPHRGRQPLQRNGTAGRQRQHGQ